MRRFFVSEQSSHQDHIGHFLYIAQDISGNVVVDDQMVNIMPACVLYEGRCLSLGAVSDHYIGSGIGYDGLFRLGVLKIGYGRPFVLLKAVGAEECNVDLKRINQARGLESFGCHTVGIQHASGEDDLVAAVYQSICGFQGSGHDGVA